MSQAPHAQFDEAVLDMIDRSPIGAVPTTPAYQDALVRLYAAHQVYASADHKDGHVTARSLASLPSFHAANLDELAAGKIRPEQLETNASIFDRYIHALPEARRQNMVRPRLSTILSTRSSLFRARVRTLGFPAITSTVQSFS